MDWKTEVLKLLYCLLLTVAGLCAFSLLLDLFCLIFLGGWPEDKFLGHWPVLTGTLYGILYAPWASSLAVLAGFTAMVRVMMGSYTPGFLKSPQADDAPGKV